MKSIGQLDRPIIIQESTKTVDSMGGTINSFSNYISCFANVDWEKSMSKENEDKIQGLQFVVFTIRNVSSNQRKLSTTKQYRIAFPVSGGSVTSETQYYNIVGIKNIEGRQKYKELTTVLDSRNKET
jgi:head-tail adaptor